MKKYLVIGLIVLVGGALLIAPLFTDVPEEPPIHSDELTLENLPAKIDFEGNPGTIFGKESTLKIKIQKPDIAKLEMKLDGVVMETWKDPKNQVEFTFVPKNLGSYPLDLVITMKDGKTYSDSRALRIISDIAPRMMEANIVQTFNHDVQSFTQGLEFYKGVLFEGTGLYGRSQVRKVNLNTGEMLQKIQLDGTYFGEGITILNDQVYQLTWKAGKCFTYDFSDGFTLKDVYTYIGEGWGLCNDGKSLIMSNGSEVIVFRDPLTFQETRRIQVYNNSAAFGYLNELEYIDGKIYANIYQSNLVIAIDPETGRVLEQINCNKLAAAGQLGGDVLNGIARDQKTGKIYMTGKNWPKLFEVNFSEVLP